MSELHFRAVEMAKQYRKLEGDLLSVLEKIQIAKVFLQQGHVSLFDYMVKGLGLSESTAYSLNVVLRKSKEVPELKSVVVAGKLSLCKARRIARVITKSTAETWLEMAEKSTVREIDRQVVRVQPQSVQEKITPKNENRSELKIGISLAFEQKLQRVQDLLASQRRENVSKEFALETALDELLEKFSARRNVGVKAHSSRQNRTLTPKTKQKILARDEDQCTHFNDRGERCQNRRYLDIHHIKHRSEGGDHEPDNLITLCSTHHGWLHRQTQTFSSVVKADELKPQFG